MNKEEIEKLAYKEYPHANIHYSIARDGFIKGFEAAQSTMYTEEQVYDALMQHLDCNVNTFTANSIIESLKNNNK
jgi:hypothetical protein